MPISNQRCRPSRRRRRRGNAEMDSVGSRRIDVGVIVTTIPHGVPEICGSFAGLRDELIDHADEGLH
jgi:hypothetical protein